MASPLFSVFFHGYVNPSWYDGLSDKSKAALRRGGRKGCALGSRRNREGCRFRRRINLATKNVTVHIHTAEQAAAMKAAMGPAFDAFAEETGDDGKKLLELVNQIGKQAATTASDRRQAAP